MPSSLRRRSTRSEYKQEFDLEGPAPEVYVVRLGTRYIVLDPDTRAGEFQVYLALDLSFDRISSWVG